VRFHLHGGHRIERENTGYGQRVEPLSSRLCYGRPTQYTVFIFSHDWLSKNNVFVLHPSAPLDLRSVSGNNFAKGRYFQADCPSILVIFLRVLFEGKTWGRIRKFEILVPAFKFTDCKSHFFYPLLKRL